MKFPPKFVESVIAEVAGTDVIPLVRALKNKQNISEFKLAKMINTEINLTRNMLYRLFDHHLVTFIRKKDKQKGWYIYYWTFNIKRIQYLVRSLQKTKLEKLRERLRREQSENFFLCPDNCVRLDFEQSVNFEFKCLECGKLLQQEDNRQKIEQISQEIIVLEKEVKISQK